MKEIFVNVRVLFLVVLAGFFVVLPAEALAISEPNGLSGIYYSSYGSTETSGGCPSWFTALDRHSTDTYPDERLIVELDGCQVTDYVVESVEQGTETPVYIDLEPGDIFIEWDEDAGDGSRGDFEFSGNYIADPDCSYAQVSATHEVINWTLFRVMSSGTLTITGTGYNEHDAIHIIIDPVDFPGNLLDFAKDDGIDEGGCVIPGDEITYTICWDNPPDPNGNGQDFYNVYIIDFLPDGVDYSGAPADPNYDDNDHSYFWYIGDVLLNDSGCVTLTVEVEVDPNVTPGYYLYNRAEMYDNTDERIAIAAVKTDICCGWDGVDPNIIYVDYTADGLNNGTSWQNAYTDLQDALWRARTSSCEPVDGFLIYVAQGEYSPGEDTDDTYKLPADISMYGGFKTGGGDRNPDKYETILTGLFDEDPIPDVDTIVTMGDETLLDGFTVTKCWEYAIYGNGVDFTVENCVIEDNARYGVYASDGNVIIKWCQVSSNIKDGIRHIGIGFDLTVENSWIMRNMQYGIYCSESTPTVKNSIISESGLGGDGHAGIGMINPTYSPVLYNNTLANNRAEGISLTNNGDPNYFNYPDVQNCIVYYNNSGGSQLTGFSAKDYAQYSSIQDCNEVNGNRNAEPGFAYTVDPSGAPDPENYHLKYDAFCKDKGNPDPTLYTGQVDMDGEDRDADLHVDIGADEVYSCEGDLSEADVYNELDLNADGIVNLWEFNLLSAAWETHEPNHLIPPVDCDFNGDWHVDTGDLVILAENWLWVACWKLEELTEAMAMGGGESMMMAPMPMEPETMSLEPEPVTMSLEPEPEPEVLVEPQPEVSPDTLVEIIDFLDEVIAIQPENAENIVDMRAILINQLEAILEQ